MTDASSHGLRDTDGLRMEEGVCRWRGGAAADAEAGRQPLKLCSTGMYSICVE